MHLREFVASLPFQHEHGLVARFTARLLRLPPQRMHVLAIAFIAYAALFTVEGIGLLMRRVWAEWLTIIATASFIPFEVVEVVRRVTAIRLSAVLINLAILG